MRYLLDPTQSRFTVQAFAQGMLAGLGHSPTFAVRDFAGELRFDPAAPAEEAIHLTIKAESLTLTDQVSPKDRAEIESRMRQEVLETAAYPEIVFRSTAISADKITDKWYRLRIAGELQLHGVTKPQAVEAQFKLSGDQARLSGQCALPQSLYLIKQVTALAGLIKLKDELQCQFDLVGRPEKD